MMQVLMVLWVANRKVYGAHKLWKAARRAGHDIGRDQVARLMREHGHRGRVPATQEGVHHPPDPDAVRAPDLVNRDFTADRPDALWVTDLTYVPTRSGMAYVCFIVDAFSRRIVGWRVASNMKTEMVLDALEMARRSRGSRRLVGLVTHSDAGSQFTSVRFTERLDEIGARPSIGTVADSLRQRAGRDDQRALQDRVRLRARRPDGWDDVDAARARHPVVGPLVQRSTASTATATTSHPPSSKQRSTLPNSPTPPVFCRATSWTLMSRDIVDSQDRRRGLRGPPRLRPEGWYARVWSSSRWRISSLSMKTFARFLSM